MAVCRTGGVPCARVWRGLLMAAAAAALAMFAVTGTAAAGVVPTDAYGNADCAPGYHASKADQPYCDKQHPGHVTIVKKTSPAGADERFTFHPSADLSPDDFELGDGEAIEFTPKPGTYTVEEEATPGWKLAAIKCDDDDSEGAGWTATIVVDSYEDVTCTFYNEEKEVQPPLPPMPPVIPPTTPASPPPSSSVPPSPPAALAERPAVTVKGTTARKATASARLQRPSSCVSRQARVTVTGSPISRIAFFVNGRRVRTFVAPRRGRAFSVMLPVGSGRVSHVTARVTFRNGVRARTLRTTVVRCAQQQVRPQFTG
jgi:hypothetical protein